jgi:hypothetical protein
MTRQAEALTVQLENEGGVWLPRQLGLYPSEPRLVRPTDFRRWAAREWLARHAGRLARALRCTSHPMRISTALGVAVRLEVRANRLHRHWVAFSGVEDWLRGVEMPNATVADDVAEHCIGFKFDRSDPPLAVAGDLCLVRCAGSGVHWYRDRELKRRDLQLVVIDSHEGRMA